MELEELKITHLERIEIKGLWGRYDIKWSLNPKVNILVGKNGSGKTTLLNLIQTLLEEEVPLDGFHSDFLSIVKIGFNDNKFLLQDGKLYDNFYNTFLYDELIRTVKISSAQGWRYDEERFASLPPTARNSIDAELYEAINLYKSYRLKLLNKERKSTQILEDKIKHFTQKEKLNDEEFKKIGKLYSEMETLRNQIHSKRKRMMDIVSDLLASTGKTVDFDEHNSFIFLNDKTIIKPHQLSTGEKQMLNLMLRVVVTHASPTVLLLDQPEVFLHPEWTVGLLDNLLQLNENMQILLVTHNPEAFGKQWRGKITRMDEVTTTNR